MHPTQPDTSSTPTEITTKDLNFAAYLSVRSCRLTKMEFRGRECYWTYRCPEGREAMWLAFLADPLEIPAAKYAAEIRDLKRQAMRR